MAFFAFSASTNGFENTEFLTDMAPGVPNSGWGNFSDVRPLSCLLSSDLKYRTS
jgi:hypothetical protein